ncbi:glycosyltransferase family 2 protein [Paenibacillus macerans]|uniref:glycosyltransferase family 2 protein n=1 Tax=Paenibacillus macerans TaxID=44252 RepID=UPI002E21249E|nr:glycosyltransferase family 2 protein [Paenibacillus macerans]
MNEKISVIISNYNYELYLDEAIKSVLSQNYQTYELIIVDDGSTDDSCSIIQKYLENYPDKIKGIFKTNGGQASAFNAAFELTTGSIIAFLDADDYWYPDKLKVISEYHEKHPAIQHNLLINNKLKFTYLEDKVCKQQRLLESYGFMGTIPTSGLSFRKSAIADIFPLPEEEYRICADLYLKTMYLNNGDIFSIDQPLGCYRAHDENNWFNSKNTMGYIDITLKNLNNLRVREGKKKIETKTAPNTFANTYIDSFDLTTEDKYVLYGSGALASEMYELLREKYYISAFTNSFVKNEELHLNLPLIPIKRVRELFSYHKLIIANTYIMDTINRLEELEFDFKSVIVPKL